MNTPARQSVLVTGATGFIGEHLVRRLLARGCRVACIVRATSRADSLLAAGAKLFACDITDRAGVSRALASSRPSVVFHLAGLVRAMDPEEFMRVNEGGVQSVAAACAQQAVPPVLVLVSSLAAAGPSGHEPSVESDRPTPVSAYGRSKLAGERAAAGHAGVVPITIVRPCVVLGPRDRGVYEMFKPIARHGVHCVPGRGDRLVSLVAAADLVECLVLAAEKGERLVAGGFGEGGRGIYFAGAEDLSYVDLGNAIASAMGKARVRVVAVPDWMLRGAGRAGDVLSRVRGRPVWVGRDKISEVLAGSWTCSSEKARRQLGWSPAAPLAERVRAAVTWYRESGWL